MTVSLSPILGAAGQSFDDNGTPLAGGKVYTYLAGTSTPVASYTTSAGNVAHSNPIILDAAGRVPTGEIWLLNGITYKFAIYTSTNVLVGTYDNIVGNGSFSGAPQNFTGDGTTTIFTLSSSVANENSTFVYINGVYQNKNTYSVSGTSLIFSQAPPTTSVIEVMY